MHKGALKAVILLIVFVLAVFVFGRMTNYTNEDLTTEMDEATLPVICLYANMMEINQLHGYSVKMDAAYMRDSITPIAEDRRLPIAIQSYGTRVDSISYEIRSLDADRLIADAEVDSYEERRGRIMAELQIQNLLEAGEEYLLIIRLESGEESIYYYTRIVEPIDCHVNECMEFVFDFHEKTFNSETLGTLATYMERTTGDNTTLQFVSLNSSLKQVGWGSFEGGRLTEPVISIKEITDSYNVFVLEYVMTSISESGENEYYNVEEYYRVRYTDSRMYMLNFERRMNQIFRGENDNLDDRYIRLGIRNGETEFKVNETGTCIAFVQEGELWSYSTVENTLAKAFSFRGYEGMDVRENYGEHDIRIARVDESSSVDFIVYGYMNRGIHEGQVGMAVYHYDGISNTNEEVVFIQSDRSYEMIRSELGQLMYISEGGELFLLVGGTVYGIDLNTLETRELVSGLTDETFAVSESNQYLAWTDGGQRENGSCIHVMNLSSQKVTDIEAKNGTYIKPLGFMKEDFIYGIAKAEDIAADAAGNVAFPMYQIKIIEVAAPAFEELKTYEKPGYYVAGIEIDDYTMYLKRIQYNGETYVEADRDMIMDREGDSGKLAALETVYSDVKQTEYRIALAGEGRSSEKAPKLLTPKETILEEERAVNLTDENLTERYYVYVKGDIILATDDVTEAVNSANENMGVVISDDQSYIWKRSRKAYQTPFHNITVAAEEETAGSIAQCINAMLGREDININVGALIEGGETPKDILNNTLREKRLLDLNGCSVDETLYYVSCGSPVFAMTGSQDAVLIIGYDANTISIFDPALGTTYRKGMTEADEIFQNAGNIFFSYLDE